MAKVSVIVPIYNVEKYLNRCVDSILAQTFTDFELILVDDGSPDNCGKICDEYAQKDGRVVVIHKENGGLSDARNAGIDWAFANSDSEWITFIDSDDWVHPKYLELLYSTNCDYNTDICVCDYLETEGVVKTDDVVSYDAEILNPVDFALKYYRFINSACTKLYRIKLFQDIRYPVGKLHEDAFVTYKIIFNANCISAINSKLYYYFQSTESIMRSAWTPRRFDEFEALLGRMEFFKLHGFKELYKCESFNIIGRAYVQLKMLQEDKNGPYNAKYEPKLRRFIRGRMKYHKKNFNDLPITGNEFLYDIAYPTQMKIYRILKEIYWIIKVQLDKLRKRG